MIYLKRVAFSPIVWNTWKWSSLKAINFFVVSSVIHKLTITVKFLDLVVFVCFCYNSLTLFHFSFSEGLYILDFLPFWRRHQINNVMHGSNIIYTTHNICLKLRITSRNCTFIYVYLVGAINTWDSCTELFNILLTLSISPGHRVSCISAVRVDFTYVVVNTFSPHQKPYN